MTSCISEISVCKDTDRGKGDTFVARMDSKADRKQHTLIIHNLHIESMKLTRPMVVKLTKAIKALAEFNQCNTIVIKKSNDKTLKKLFVNS